MQPAITPLRRMLATPVAAVFLSFYIGPESGFAQTFISGSNGSDGALTLMAPGTILFDPKDTATFGRVLDPDGDNVFHFTEITIGPGVTLKLSGKILTGPVFWLASGAVNIDGTIDLDGENGYADNTIGNTSKRIPAAPGSGGYSGGVGGTFVVGSPSLPVAQPGNGPGGGPAGAPFSVGGNATFTGNLFLIPLVGGSGGGGGNDNVPTHFGGGGGGGGGALVIASSVRIALATAPGRTGVIRANGGSGDRGPRQVPGGGGSGGAIRLVAPEVRSFGNSGLLSVTGGAGASGAAQQGRVRVEAFVCCEGVSGIDSVGVPSQVFVPATPPPSLRVVSVAGIPVNASPFIFPSVTINSPAPVVVNIEARNIPPGTIPRLFIFSESGADQMMPASPLVGMFAASTSTVSITLPTGVSRGFVKALW